MKRYLARMPLTTSALLVLALSGCSSVKVWPFNDRTSTAAPRTPANAIEYRCDAGKHFYVRTIDNGNAVWLIYPDREVSLSKTSANSGIQYTNGVAILEIKDTEASLVDGATISYNGCKPATGK